MPIYNCSSSGFLTLTIKQLLDMGISLSQELPMDHFIWVAAGGVTLNKTMNYIKLISFQVLPALAIDAALKFKGHKPL